MSSGDYGPVSISHDVTIRCTGFDARLLSFLNIPAITINSGKVVIDGLNIEGYSLPVPPGLPQPPSPPTGISVANNSSLKIINSHFNNLGVGLTANGGTIVVTRSDFTNTGNAVTLSGSGTTEIDHSNFYNGTIGVSANNSGTLDAVTVRDCDITGFQQGVSVKNTNASGGAIITLIHSNIVGNNIGVNVQSTHAQARLIGTTVTANTVGLQASGGGLIASYGNNEVFANTNDGTFSATLPPK